MITFKEFLNLRKIGKFMTDKPQKEPVQSKPATNQPTASLQPEVLTNSYEPTENEQRRILKETNPSEKND